jgi:hypothetical protein
MRRLARAKRGLNKIDNKSDIKTVEINGFGRVYRRPSSYAYLFLLDNLFIIN